MRSFNLLLWLSLGGWAHAQVHLSPAEDTTQEQAIAYCRELGSSWRLMSIKELFILDSSTPFRDGFSYWSATQIASGDAVVGTGSEGDGGVIAMIGYSFYPKERNITLSPLMKKIAAACTNVPQIKHQHEYHLTPQGTEDKHSGLLWHSLEMSEKRAKYTYEQAKEMCENMTLHGRSWRLPSVDELYGIIDYNYSRPSVDMTFFGPMMHRYYWSSDSFNDKDAYVVGFKLGSVATAPKKEEAHARCVSE